MESGTERPGVDTGVPSVARVYDFLLGGKDHYAVDREFARRLAARCPNLDFAWEVRQNRGFMTRAVRHLAREVGVRQFLDIGTGLPTQENVHQVAQDAAPDARVVYVDNDPIVLAHARALLTGTPQGATRYIDADLRDPDRIVELAAETLDFTRPVAVNLIAVLHFIPDPDPVVARLREALPVGSHLVISHAIDRPEFAAIAEEYQREMGVGALRPFGRIQGFFGRDGWEMLDPGLVPVALWRPEVPTMVRPGTGIFVAGVARKVS
ncbi:SAM-dependent methyltransferase [Actinomadura rayongensis]|uniref:SAM-dependent methyltransferase n=1 Tax=Actinomadura rayongensis TaxID=1429076 RepID=A0A6I4WBT1_9ACTN|nr:SAM-dependent methyltransferase [Actinomadura rayongensis]MXQ66280.1 SAM-dependent methyltransferase [Actinomadura rayongensis]